MSLENYIKRYTSGHSASRKMQEMYDNADKYTYEQFEEQLDKAKYRPSKKDNDVGGNSMEYQKLLDRYDGNEERANQEFDGTMGAYRANKAQAMSDFLAKKMASLKDSMPKQEAKPEPAPAPEPEPEKKEKKPVTYSPQIQEALSRVRNYESKYTNQVLNNEYNFGFNKFKKNKENGPTETTMPVSPRTNGSELNNWDKNGSELNNWSGSNKYTNNQYDFSNV